MQQQERGIQGFCAEEVFIGNGVSELIDLSVRALLNSGDEVLIPRQDYPLWSAAVSLNDGTPKYYDCDQHNGFLPDADQIESLITSQTRAIVVINPNNPSGAVYDSRAFSNSLSRYSPPKHGLIVLADEIYDQMVYDDAEFIPNRHTGQATAYALRIRGLSKVYRACGYRVGWCVFGGDLEEPAITYTAWNCSRAASLLVIAGPMGCADSAGRVPEHRRTRAALVRPHVSVNDRCIIDRVSASPYLTMQEPMGAMYAFIKLGDRNLPRKLDDQSVRARAAR